MGQTVTTNPEPLAGSFRRWLRDRRPRRVIYWLLIIWTLNLFDVAFTIYAIQAGRFREGNPLAKGFADRAELWNLFAFKMIFLLLATWLFVRNRRHWFCEVGLILAAAAYLAVSLLWLQHAVRLEAIAH